MAEYTGDIKNIKVDVNAIRQRFGGKIKQPSNPEDDPNKEEEIDLFGLLLKGMSSALFGAKQDKKSGWNNIFDNTKTSLYSYIKSINTILSGNDKPIGVGGSTSVVRLIGNTNIKLNEILKSLNENTNIKLNDISELLKNDKESLKSDKKTKLTSSSSSDYTINAINALKELVNIVEQKEKLNNLEKFITDGKLQNILEKINENLNITIDEKVFDNIDLFKNTIEALTGLTELNFAKIKYSERILDYINGEYFNKIKKIIDSITNLPTSDEEKSKKIIKQLEVLKDIIDIIPSIGELKLKDLLWSRISINYLDYFIEDKIPLILDSLEKILKDRPTIEEKIEKLDKYINSILSIFKINTEELENNKDSLDLINSLIKNELKTVISSIGKEYDDLDNIELRLSNIENIITRINDVQNALPSVMSILKSIIKLSLIQEEFDIINSIINPKKLKEKYDKYNIFEVKPIDFEKIDANLKSFVKVLQTLKEVNDNVQNIKLKDSLKVLTNVYTELTIINRLFKKLTNLNEKYKEPLKFESLKETISNFNQNVLEQISGISYNIEPIYSLIDSVNSLIVLLNNINLEELENIDLTNFSKVIEEKINILMNSISYITNENINEDTIKNIELASQVITKLTLLSNLKLLETITEKSLDPLIGVSQKLVTIVDIIKNIKPEDVEGANKLLNSLMKLVVGTAGILIFGTLIMMYLDWTALASFAVSLGAFIGGILWVYSKFSKDQLEASFESAKDLGLLIMLSGAILVLGTLFMRYVDYKELFGFTLALEAFIGGILWVYSIFSDKLKNTFNSAFDFGLLIAISGGTLIFGSLLYHLINWEDLTGFAIALGVFMLGMLAIYALFNASFENALKGAKDFAILLATSAGLMILGGLIGDWVSEHDKDIFGFGLRLMAFTILIGAPWILGSLWFKNALKGAKEFAILITVSAAVMILGPLLLEEAYDGNLTKAWLSTIGFGVLLGVFILAVGGALYLANKNAKSSVIGATALALAVGISAAALIAGPAILKHYNVEWYEVLGFAVLLAGFIFGMSYVLNFAGKKLPDIALGGIAVVIIGAIAFGAAWVVKEISDMLFTVHWEDLLNGLGDMALVFGAVGTVMGIIGALVTGTGGAALLIAAGGAAVLATLEGLVWGAAKVVNAIAISMKNLAEASALFVGEDGKFDVKKVQNILEIVNAFGNVLKLLTDKISLKTAGILTAIMPGVLLGIGALSMIGNVVKDWANMIVPDIDPNTGKKIGYRKLTTTEISDAITNIKNVLTAIGNAIVEVTKDPNNKDIFGEGFLQGKSPFRVAMESFKYSGDILSGIAEGIKTWSSMAVPNGFDNKGKPKGYISLNEATFTKTQGNIKAVLVGIGSAICDVVNNKKYEDYFRLGKRAPAMIAAKAIKEASSALIDITNVIKTFSSNDFKSIIDNLEDPNKGAIANVHKVVEGIVNILKIFLDPYKENSRGVIASWFVGEKTFVENLNDNRGEISKSAETVKIFCNNIENIFKSISELGQKLSQNNEGLKFIANENFTTDIKNSLNNLTQFTTEILGIKQSKIGSLKKIDEALNNNINNISSILFALDFIGKQFLTYQAGVNLINIIKCEFSNNLNNFIKEVKNIQDLSSLEKIKNVLNSKINDIKSMLSLIGDIGKEIEKNKNEFNTISYLNIQKVIWQINNIQRSLLGIITSRKNINGDIEDIKNSYDKINNTLNLLLSTFTILKQLSEYSKSVEELNGIESLSKGISDLLNKLATKETELSNFKQLSDNTKEFIEHINSLDINKANTLQSLIKAMTELSEKVKSLDKLAEIFSEKITAVLYELTLQLRKAEAVITDAHELQEYRRKLINESIDKVKNIMNQHMVVEVYKKKEDGELGYNGANNYKPTDTNTPSGNTDIPSAATTSAEDATPQPPEILRRDTSSNTDDVLTVQKFIALMQQNLDKFWGK